MRVSSPWLTALLLFLLVAFSTGLRIEKALDSGHFDANPVGSVRADPGLLYYLTERFADSPGEEGEWPMDTRIEHPDGVSIPAQYSLGQEGVVALVRRFVGDGMPTHQLALRLMAFLASLTLLGVYGLARELTGSSRWGLVAAALHALTPAAYRSIGFVFVREDLCLPLYAAHLWLVARTWRTRSTASGLWAGITLGLSLATWHAAGFLVALECAAAWLLFLRRDRNPFGRGPALMGLIAALAICLLVPSLRAKGALLSPAMAGFLALACAARFSWQRPGRLAAGLVALAVFLGLGRVLAGYLGSGADLDHVLALLLAKVRFLGHLPADPGQLDFDVRMMWQGPFATLEWREARRLLGPSLLGFLVLTVATASRWLRGEGEDMHLFIGLLVALLGLGSWLTLRVSAALVIVLPAAIALWFSRRNQARKGRSLSRWLPFAGAGFMLVQSLVFLGWASHLNLDWHWNLRRDRDRAMVAAIEQFVPEGRAVAADFMSSTVILAHTQRPIIVQPKWERALSRRRVERLWELLYHSPPSELAQALQGPLQTEYLLMDRHTLQWLKSSRYLAGIPGNGPELPAGSAAEALLAGNSRDEYSGVDGFELLWSDEPVAAFPDGSKRDFYRLFRLVSLTPPPR